MQYKTRYIIYYGTIKQIQFRSQKYTFVQHKISIAIFKGNNITCTNILKKYYFYIESYKSLNIIEYVDNNYVDNFQDQKSIINYYFFMNGAIII